MASKLETKNERKLTTAFVSRCDMIFSLHFFNVSGFQPAAMPLGFGVIPHVEVFTFGISFTVFLAFEWINCIKETSILGSDFASRLQHASKDSCFTIYVK